MSAVDDRIQAIKTQIAELQAQLDALESENGAVALFAEYQPIKDLGLGPQTVANVVATWEQYKAGKLIEPVPVEPVTLEPAPQPENVNA